MSQVLGNVIFYALLTVLSLTAVPYGTVEPWWRAVFECAIFTLSLLWIVDGMLSGTWFVAQHRLLIPLPALVVFALIQTVLPLRSGSSDPGAGLLPTSFAPYDTKMVAFQLLALAITGGLLLDDNAQQLLRSTNRFPMSQDQRNTLHAGMKYRLGRRSWIGRSEPGRPRSPCARRTCRR